MPMLVLIIPAFIAIAIICRVAAGDWDRGRVREYIEQRGGSVLSIEWKPFGPGWFGSEHTRVYQVRYIDIGGNEHDAFVKTNMFAGVYFTEDRIVPTASDAPLATPSDMDALLTENEALRAELARLRESDA